MNKNKNKTDAQIQIEELLRAEDEIMAMQGKSRSRTKNREDRLMNAFMEMDTFQLLALQDCITDMCELSDLYKLLSDKRKAQPDLSNSDTFTSAMELLDEAFKD